jgi:hypothetical protein
MKRIVQSCSLVVFALGASCLHLNNQTPEDAAANADVAIHPERTGGTSGNPGTGGPGSSPSGVDGEVPAPTGPHAIDAPGEGTAVDAASMSPACVQGTAGCCAAGTRACNGTCIPSSACCTDGDCPMKDVQVGKCDLSAHQCEWSCGAGTKPCGGKCLPSSACCDDGECSGNRACVGNACSGTTCRAGYKTCGNECVLASECCRADGCCANSDCGRCEKCSSGACVKQGDKEDLKDDCAGGTCKTGLCDGRGGCGTIPDGQSGPGCNAGPTCKAGAESAADVCEGGTCKPGASRSCGKYPCNGNRCATRCPEGTNEGPTACISCGRADSEECCNSGNPCSGANLICSVATRKCFPCGAFDQPCCTEFTNEWGFASKKGSCNNGLYCRGSGEGTVEVTWICDKLP